MKPWITWLGVYQSKRCCDVSASFDAPCHSLIVPQEQIGSRPMASRIAAVAAISTAQTSAVRAGVKRGAGAAGARSEAGMHASRIEDAVRIEARLQPCLELHHGGRERLEDVCRRPE